MSRPRTPDRKTATGIIGTVQRACNGCGRSLGDVTDAEMDEAVAGLPLSDVRAECGCVPAHYTEMFTTSDFTSPGTHWGYQCFTCSHEEAGYATLALATAAADQHGQATS